jgi:cytidylate kinase
MLKAIVCSGLVCRNLPNQNGGLKMGLITITKTLGSKGTEIAKRVSEGLHLDLYDDESLQVVAVKLGIKSDELKSLDEKAPGLFDRIWSRRPQLYLDLMESMVYEVAKQGHGVIIGHASQFLLQDFGCALHALVDASKACRVQNIMDQYDVSLEVAEKLMRKSDEEHRGLMQYAFHMNWDDHSVYDLVINSEKLGTALSAHLIMETARSGHIEECSLTALDAMDRLSLKKRIEAGLLRANLSLNFLYVDVPEKGVAHVRGFADSRETRDRIVDEVQNIRGVSRVDPEIFVRTMSAI